jgi:hypothetical protein
LRIEVKVNMVDDFWRTISEIYGGIVQNSLNALWNNLRGSEMVILTNNWRTIVFSVDYVTENTIVSECAKVLSYSLRWSIS